MAVILCLLSPGSMPLIGSPVHEGEICAADCDATLNSKEKKASLFLFGLLFQTYKLVWGSIAVIGLIPFFFFFVFCSIICGLTQFTNKSHLAFAALEAVCFQTREVVISSCLDFLTHSCSCCKSVLYCFV